MGIRPRLDRLKREWQLFRQAPAGERFQRRYARQAHNRSSFAWKVVWIALGLVFFVIGIIMLAAPGPGLLVLFVACSMVAGESRWAARTLDRLELKARAFAARVRGRRRSPQRRRTTRDTRS